MPPKPRRFREAHKRQVAARQGWRCSGCETLLESTFQVDHTVPLWKGGEDSVDNATAICVACHARKTQDEAIERADIAQARRIREAEDAEREAERAIRAEEEAARVERVLPGGHRRCILCNVSYYAIFRHSCPVVKERIDRRMGRRPEQPPEEPNPFARFMFTAGRVNLRA